MDWVGSDMGKFLFQLIEGVFARRGGEGGGGGDQLSPPPWPLLVRGLKEALAFFSSPPSSTKRASVEKRGESVKQCREGSTN